MSRMRARETRLFYSFDAVLYDLDGLCVRTVLDADEQCTVRIDDILARPRRPPVSLRDHGSDVSESPVF